MFQATHKDLMGAFEYMLHKARDEKRVGGTDSDLAEYASEIAGEVLREGKVNMILKAFTE